VVFRGPDGPLAGLEPPGERFLERNPEFAVPDLLELAAALDLVEAVTDPGVGCRLVGRPPEGGCPLAALVERAGQGGAPRPTADEQHTHPNAGGR